MYIFHVIKNIELAVAKNIKFKLNAPPHTQLISRQISSEHFFISTQSHYNKLKRQSIINYKQNYLVKAKKSAIDIIYNTKTFPTNLTYQKGACGTYGAFEDIVTKLRKQKKNLSIAIINGIGTGAGDSIIGLTALNVFHKLLLQVFTEVKIDLFQIDINKNSILYKKEKTINALYQLPLTLINFLSYDAYVDLSSLINWEDFNDRPMIDFYLQTFSIDFKRINNQDKSCKISTNSNISKVIELEINKLKEDNHPLLLFHPKASDPIRSIPANPYFAMLQYLTKNTDYTIVSVIPIKYQHPRVIDISILSESIDHLISIIALMDAIITVDTVVYHIANSFKIPCSVIFTTIHPSYRICYYPFIAGVTLVKDLTKLLESHKTRNKRELNFILDQWKSMNTKNLCTQLLDHIDYNRVKIKNNDFELASEDFVIEKKQSINKLVSIIMPAFNSELFIEESIQSVVEQSYSNWELIIIDDGSTDNTSTLINTYKKIDKRIRHYKQINKGPAAARNNGIKRAKGKYITFLDSDDMYLKNGISLLVNEIDHYDRIALIYADLILLNEKNQMQDRFVSEPLEKPQLYHQFLFSNPIIPSSIIVRKELLLSLGGFNENYPFIEDYDLWLRIIEIAEIGKLNEKVCIRRLDSNIHKYNGSKLRYYHDLARYTFLKRINIDDLFLDVLSPLEKSKSLEVLAYKIIQRRKDLLPVDTILELLRLSQGYYYTDRRQKLIQTFNQEFGNYINTMFNGLRIEKENSRLYLNTPVIINMSVYNRRTLLKQTIQSLAFTRYDGEIILVINDDCSPDTKIESSLCVPENIKIIYRRNSRNKGHNINSIDGISYCFKKYQSDFVINLDSDTLFNPDWLEKMVTAHDEYTYLAIATISGFNVNYKWHKEISDLDKKICLKNTVGGFGLLITKKFWSNYGNTIKEIIIKNPKFCWDYQLCKLATKHNYLLLSLKESSLQHTGISTGIHTNVNLADFANNFVGIGVEEDLNTKEFWQKSKSDNLSMPSSKIDIHHIKETIINTHNALDRTLNVLHVAGNDGSWLNNLSISFLNKFVLDINPDSIKKGKKQFKHITFNEHDINLKTTYSDEYFDIIYCFDLLQHVRDINSVIRELLRIAKHSLWIGVPLNMCEINNHNHHIFTEASIKGQLENILGKEALMSGLSINCSKEVTGSKEMLICKIDLVSNNVDHKLNIKVVIPHFGDDRVLYECLESLDRIPEVAREDIIIINNNQDNRYFTIAVNEGIKQALGKNADYIWILNNDTKPYPDYLTHTLKRFELSPNAGLVGAKNLEWDNPNRINWAGEENGKRKMGFVSRGDYTHATVEPWAPFTSVVIKSAVFHNIGLLDPKMLFIYSDNDFCHRMCLSKSEIWYEPNAVILHKLGVSVHGSSNPKTQQIMRNDRAYYHQKWHKLNNNSANEDPKELNYKLIHFLYLKTMDTKSDINEHIPTLLKFAEECQYITEFGTRHGNSTIAFMKSKPKRLDCYDINRTPVIDILSKIAKETDLDFNFHQEDVLDTEIQPTDLLFIDTLHTYDQIKAELALHADKVGKYIIFHDTETYRENGELPGQNGIWPAIDEYMQKNKNKWELAQHFTNNNGLTIYRNIAKVDKHTNKTMDREIITISMVKNEEDIIESFVRYHLAIVSRMLIFDHNSSDNTLNILNQLKEEGLNIHILHGTHIEKKQNIITTDLLRQACNLYNPDIIIPLDADEFIISKNKGTHPGNILNKIDLNKLYYIKWKTFVPHEADNPDEWFIPRRISHYRPEELEKHSKVLITRNISREYSVSIDMGNHDVTLDKQKAPPHLKQKLEALRIAHYPIRSIEQLKSKILVGWINSLCRVDRQAGQSVHQHFLYNKIKNSEGITNKELKTIAANYGSSSNTNNISLENIVIDTSFCQNICNKYTDLRPSNYMNNLLDNCENLAKTVVELKNKKKLNEDTREHIKNVKNNLMTDSISKVNPEFFKPKKTNTQLYPMRAPGHFKDGLQDLIVDLPNNLNSMIEVGCYAGESTEMFKDSNKFKNIICIDPYIDNYNDHSLVLNTLNIAKQSLLSKFNDSMELIEMPFQETDSIIINDSIDFCYIDGDHSYDAVKADILLAAKKVKIGGYLAGHDYNYFFGVPKAVNELIRNNFPLLIKLYKDSSWKTPMTSELKIHLLRILASITNKDLN